MRQNFSAPRILANGSIVSTKPTKTTNAALVARISPRDRRRREAAKAELNRQDIAPLTPRQQQMLKQRPR